MKRMNLIRAALFAVFAFMGTISLSAQQNWLPPAAAIVVITNELNLLNEPPVATPTAGISTKQAVLESYAKSNGCSDCMLKSVKQYFLEHSLHLIYQGNDTGVAVEAVRADMINNANGNPTGLAAIQQAYEYMQNIL